MELQEINSSREKNHRLLILLIIVSFCHGLCFSQDSSANNQRNEYWARVGVGITSARDYFGLGGTAGIQYSSGIGLLGVRYISADRATVEPETPGGTRLAEISEIDVTWGVSKRVSFLYFSLSSGLGIVWGRKISIIGDEHFTTIGLPIEGEVTLRLLPVFGIGAMLSSTINPKKTVINQMIVLQIGKLK